MATKSTTSTTTTEKKWTICERSFTLDQYPNCCGLDVATGFTIKPTAEEKKKTLPANHWGYYYQEPEKARTLPEIYRWYDTRIKASRAAQLVQVALISKYKEETTDGRTEQVPGFIDYLKGKGWVEQQSFINPAHGNEIMILQKKYRGRNMNNW